MHIAPWIKASICTSGQNSLISLISASEISLAAAYFYMYGGVILKYALKAVLHNRSIGYSKLGAGFNTLSAVLFLSHSHI